VGSLERRLRTLEANKQDEVADLSKEALRHLSDEDLDALEGAVERGVQDGRETFEDLYAVAGERSRRALDALCLAYETVRAKPGEEPPSRDPPASGDAYGRLQRIWAEDEEARREWERRNGYRIWKYRE
jgi:hypothetical protein